MRLSSLLLAGLLLTACGGSSTPADGVAEQLEAAYDQEDGQRAYDLSCPSLQRVSPAEPVLAEFDEIVAKIDGVEVEVGEPVGAGTYDGTMTIEAPDGETEVGLLFREEDGAWCYTYPAETG